MSTPSLHRRSLQAACAVLAVTALAAVWQPWKHSPTPPSLALLIESSATDFGEVLEVNPYTVRVPLRNTSPRTLDITFQKSCDCAGVEPSVMRLAAGEKGTLTVRLDLTHNRHHYQGQPRRPYRAHVTAVFGDRGYEQVPIEVRGVVRAIMDMTPPNLHLRDELVVNEAGAEEAVEIKPVLPLGSVSVKATPPHLEARVEETRSGYRLHVRPKPTARVGPFRETIELHVADRENRRLPDQTYLVTGTVTGRYVAFPAESTFGLRALGTRGEETVRIVPRRGEPFTVETIKTGDAEVTRVAEGEYRVRQTFGRLSEQRANVTFVVRDGAGGRHAVNYTATYYGSAEGGR